MVTVSPPVSPNVVAAIFYDPENERNFGNFAQAIFGSLIHAQVT
jgi:hypothetical protein